MSQRGFTLIEVLVALLLLSVAVVAVLQLFGGGLRLARASGDHLEATLLATAKLAELTGAETLEEGTSEGAEGAYRWTRRVVIDPALQPEQDPATTPSTQLARVAVEVRWGRNRQVELVTLRPLRETPAVASPARVAR